MLTALLSSCKNENLPHLLDQWNFDNMGFIQVDIRLSDGQTEILKITDAEKMNDIVSYLKKTSFTHISEVDPEKVKLDGDWKVRLVFDGLRDQIFLFDQHAFVGKTTYVIGEGVAEKLITMLL